MTRPTPDPHDAATSLPPGTWPMLLRLAAQQWRGLALGVITGLAWTVGKVAVPQLTRLAIDRGITGGGSAGSWALLVALAGVVTGTFTALRRYVAFRESRWVETRLRGEIFSHVLALDARYHDHASTGQLMSRASSDLQQLQLFVVMIPLTLSNVALILGVVGVLVVTDPLLALVALTPLPFINWTARRFSGSIHPAVMAVQSEQAQLATVVEESVSGVRVVKGFGAEAVQADKLRTEADDIQDASLRAAMVRARYLPFMELLPSLGIIAVLGVGGHRVLDGSMTIGELVAFNFYVALLVWPLRTIGMTLAFAQRAGVALHRVREVLDAEPAVVDPERPARLPSARRAVVDRLGDGAAGTGVPHATGAVRFDDVWFGYDPDDPVLRGLDLEVPAGGSLAIVGATGSGKSTIARLLVRFYDPQRGTVSIDGVDVRDLAVGDVRRAVGLVFEDTFLFHESVAANIAFARADATPDEIRRAARLAGAHDFVVDLPEGYDTVLGERGFSLSGGQRQRIAIARAVLADPRVLVLDDATSAVDPSKEHEIRAAMRTVMDGRTTIVIAHRPGTIAIADRVALVDDGRVAASGTHDELLAGSARYRDVLAALTTADHEGAGVVLPTSGDPGAMGGVPGGGGR